MPLDFSPNEIIWDTRFKTALYLRDYDSTDRVIAATPPKFANDIFDGQPIGEGKAPVPPDYASLQPAGPCYARLSRSSLGPRLRE